MSLEVDRSFQLLVDDEMLLEHNGPNALVGDGGYKDVGYGDGTEPKKCCYGTCHGASSLFEQIKDDDGDDVTYVHFPVPNSSFIETIRWWSYEAALGENALEVHFKDGNYACYADVPEGVVLDWINEIKDGQSAGKYFNWKIKDEYESIMES
jgi:hypothetical protein